MSTALQNLVVREARLPEDRVTLETFVHALNAYEHPFAPDRRLDPAVGPDYFAVLLKRVSENDGRLFVAELAGMLVGWIVSIIEVRDVFVIEEERRVGYVAELFVEERVRGAGVGRALIERAEEDFRSRGFRRMGITALAGNARARAAYISYGFEPSAIDLSKQL